MKFNHITSILLLVSLQLLVATACTREKKYEQPPNIVIVLTDDQGWGDLSIHGNKNLSTPHIDAISRNGASFTNFFVQPVCSPTRAELLTGQYAARLGVWSTSAGGERMSLEATTIAQVFKNSGYATALYGKWHNGMQPPYHPNTRGFDDFYGFCSGHWGNYFDPLLERNGKLVKGNGYLANDLFDKGLEFINKNKDRPFLLMLPVNTPHSPMQVPDKYWQRFADKELEMKYSDSTKEDENFTRAALAMVENIDENVGRLTTRLQELELSENTIVVFLSDNGPNSWRWNGNLKGKKGSTNEGGVKSPLFIQWKNNIDPGIQIKQIASAIDLLPTLSSLAKITLPAKITIDGENLAPLLKNPELKTKDRVIYNYWRDSVSLRTQKYRLDSQNHLFDMKHDLGQERDISENEKQLTDSLIQLKNDWWENTVLKNNPGKDLLFTLGHSDFVFTQIPARDATPKGNIKRSNKYPNDSFLHNWISVQDSIHWPIEVLEEGLYEVALYYTCKEENIGTEIKLDFNGQSIVKTIKEWHDPPLKGMENDRSPRIESYVKDFLPVRMGAIELKKGKGSLALTATKIPGKEAIDFRLLLFKRLE